MSKFKVGDRVRSKYRTDYQIGIITYLEEIGSGYVRDHWVRWKDRPETICTEDELEPAENGLDIMLRISFEAL